MPRESPNPGVRLTLDGLGFPPVSPVDSLFSVGVPTSDPGFLIAPTESDFPPGAKGFPRLLVVDGVLLPPTANGFPTGFLVLLPPRVPCFPPTKVGFLSPVLEGPLLTCAGLLVFPVTLGFVFISLVLSRPPAVGCFLFLPVDKGISPAAPVNFSLTADVFPTFAGALVLPKLPGFPSSVTGLPRSLIPTATPGFLPAESCGFLTEAGPDEPLVSEPTEPGVLETGLTRLLPDDGVVPVGLLPLYGLLFTPATVPLLSPNTGLVLFDVFVGRRTGIGNGIAGGVFTYPINPGPIVKPGKMGTSSESPQPDPDVLCTLLPGDGSTSPRLLPEPLVTHPDGSCGFTPPPTPDRSDCMSPCPTLESSLPEPGRIIVTPAEEPSLSLP